MPSRLYTMGVEPASCSTGVESCSAPILACNAGGAQTAEPSACSCVRSVDSSDMVWQRHAAQCWGIRSFVCPDSELAGALLCSGAGCHAPLGTSHSDGPHSHVEAQSSQLLGGEQLQVTLHMCFYPAAEQLLATVARLGRTTESQAAATSRHSPGLVVSSQRDEMLSVLDSTAAASNVGAWAFTADPRCWPLPTLAPMAPPRPLIASLSPRILLVGPRRCLS
jgi:hypothetical protein